MDVYQWREEDEDQVLTLYEIHCRQKFTHELSSGKKNYYKGLVDPVHKLKHPTWIPPFLIPAYTILWETPEVKAKSDQAKKTVARVIVHIGAGLLASRTTVPRRQSCWTRHRIKFLSLACSRIPEDMLMMMANLCGVTKWPSINIWLTRIYYQMLMNLMKTD